MSPRDDQDNRFFRWGCTVTAFSTSPSKEVEAKQFGAHHFVVTSRPEEVAFAVGQLTLNHIFSFSQEQLTTC